MKRLAVFLVGGLMAAPALADAPPTASQPLQKVLVWALGKNASDTAKVELDVLEALADHHVTGDRVSKIFPQGLPASAADAVTQMRASGCDSILVLRRRSTIDWESSFKTKALSSLQAFISSSGRLLNPKNQAVADSVAPIEVSNSYGNIPMQIVEGEGIVFDLKTEKRIWRDDTSIKSAKDLPTDGYYQLVAEKVTTELAAAGLIPPGKTKMSLDILGKDIKN